MKCRVENKKAQLGIIPLDLPRGLRAKDGDNVKVLIRPENIEVKKMLSSIKKKEELTTGIILNRVFLGSMVRLRISLGHGVSLISVHPKSEVTEQRLKDGDKVYVSISKYSIFPESTEVLITVPIAKILKV